MALKGTKVARHGSDGGASPSRNSKNMHQSMGKNVSAPDKTPGQARGDSAMGGHPHGSIRGAGKNTMPKAICHAQGPQKMK